MIDIDRMERIYERCGGVFRATVLIQKRVKELNRGAKYLVDGDFRSPIEVAIREIEEGKLELMTNNDENREKIRAEMEKHQKSPAVPEIQVSVDTGEDELERRIMSALAKERNA
jgi:DNA-directed RNA polymerase subunit K/omega